MFTYINENYMVADHCLLAYTGNEAKVVIPEDIIEGQPVTEIGNQAFALKKNLQSIIFPDSINSIGKDALKGCDFVNYIEFPMGIKQISQLFESGFPCRNICIRSDESELDLLRAKAFNFVSGTDSYLVDSSLLGNINSIMGCWRGIMTEEQIKANKSQRDKLADYTLHDSYNYIFKDIDPLSSFVEKNKNKILPMFSRTMKFPESEFDAVMDLINDETIVYEDEKSEAKGVWAKKNRLIQDIPLKVFLLGENGKSAAFDAPVIAISPLAGYFFFPSAKHIVCDGDYWVYRRCYISTEGYIPRDIAIFDRNGIVTAPAKKRTVYAKYRFITSL